MSERAYYKVSLTPSTVTSRGGAAKSQGITDSALVHELPRWSVAPDQSYGLLRVHWDDGAARDAYEGKSHVAEITDMEAATLVASWTGE